MTRVLGSFFIIIAFIVGLSVGLYSGIEIKKEERLALENTIQSTVQDAVLRKIQSTDNEDRYKIENINNSGDTEPMVVVSARIEEISPNAQMIIMKNYTKCGHSKIDRTNVPNEIVNYTKEELSAKYTGWSIDEFSSNEIVLSRDIDANCDDHFVLKEVGGKIAVYNEVTEDKMNLVEIVDTDVNLLGEQDRIELANGIRVYGQSELSSIIEDYEI